MPSPTTLSTGTTGAATTPSRRVLVAGTIGNFVEWFDIGIYGTLSSVIAANFFADGDPTSAILSTFAIFAVGFAIRPLGALYFGPLADRIGRNRVLAITVIVTSLATFGIGVLPTYASIGALAPILLVVARLVQGFAAGGETSSSVGLLFEYAPRNRRGFYTSFGASIGFVAFVAGAGLALILTLIFGDDQLTEFAWRIPFLIALPLGIAGLYLRMRLDDTPEFIRLERSGEVAASPLRETFRTGRRAMLILGGVIVLKGVAHWVLQTYMVSHLSRTLHFSAAEAFTASTICMAVVAVVIPVAGLLSDKVGRKPVMILGAAGLIVLAWPALALMTLGNAMLAVLAMVALGIPLAAYDGAVNASMAELFPSRIRTGAIAIPYNIVVSLLGGTAPYIAAWLTATSGYTPAPAFYLMFAAAITLTTVIVWVKETTGPKAEVDVTA
ncbi:MFS transporter [Mycolicibacterium mageritense]|uniref:MFS transporter n=1 Tax=Mycolicibacterium mageritense TaxID=53462 RepID=UPI0011D38E43|nr:MFS transporter [Mycolicibacterium mageritense]TXI54990.1 MAG: MFS transporter [Mycolicibacterium mageritense]